MNEIRDWHLDRRVTLAFIFMLFFNTAGLVWNAATMKAELLQQRKEIDQHYLMIVAAIEKDQVISEKLVKIETGQVYLTKVVERVEKKISNAD